MKALDILDRMAAFPQTPTTLILILATDRVVTPKISGFRIQGIAKVGRYILHVLHNVPRSTTQPVHDVKGATCFTTREVAPYI